PTTTSSIISSAMSFPSLSQNDSSRMSVTYGLGRRARVFVIATPTRLCPTSRAIRLRIFAILVIAVLLAFVYDFNLVRTLRCGLNPEWTVGYFDYIGARALFKHVLNFAALFAGDFFFEFCFMQFRTGDNNIF